MNIVGKGKYKLRPFSFEPSPLVIFNDYIFHNSKMSLELVKCRNKWYEKELEGIACQQISPTCVYGRVKQVEDIYILMLIGL